MKPFNAIAVAMLQVTAVCSVQIAQLDTYVLQQQYPIVVVTMSDGSIGFGQASYALTPNETDIIVTVFHTMVAPTALGMDPSNILEIDTQVLWAQYKSTGSFLTRAVAGLDTALWDWQAKQANMSVCNLARLRIQGPSAGPCPSSKPIYGSNLDRTLQPSALASKMITIRDTYGVQAFKTKIGMRMGNNSDQWPGRTEALVPLLRQALGANISLAADANGASTTAAHALPWAQLLATNGYVWYEEPVVWWNYSQATLVQSSGLVPVALGEQEYRLSDWEAAFAMGAVQIAQPDIGYSGGFTAALQVAALADRYGKKVDPHSPNPSLVDVFVLHFLGAIPNAGPWMEYACVDDGSPTSFFFTPGLTIKQGALAIPTGPGWGVTVDPSLLERAPRRTSSFVQH